MRKQLKVYLIMFALIILSTFIFYKINIDKPKVKPSDSIVTQNNDELDKILKTRDYRVIDNKEYIQYELPYSMDEIMKNSKLMFQLIYALKDENTFFTMLKLNDGNGILAQDHFKGLTIGHLTDEFCIIDKVLYNGTVYNDKIVYHDLPGGMNTVYK